ncbi:ATP-binding protein [Nonomuraea sp. NPDC049649]|uniref:ATP-binding protein n=1 Tax=Nonomuraea sp. NPDC049649 TaxID=3155776 RepID=UPI003430896A
MRRPPQPTPTRTPRITYRRSFPATYRSVPEARDWARSLLGPSPTLDDTLLLLSEVVTNAITHSDSGHNRSGAVTVQITRAASTIQVEVSDAGSSTTTPTVRTPTLSDDRGRGLWLVNMLSDHWGFQHDESGVLVWFNLTQHD